MARHEDRRAVGVKTGGGDDIGFIDASESRRPAGRKFSRAGGVAFEPVTPAGGEFAIVTVIADQQMGNGQRQRHVAAGIGPQPQICQIRGRAANRVNHDDSAAALLQPL